MTVLVLAPDGVPAVASLMRASKGVVDARDEKHEV
jgi:hypothetical protein